MRSDGECMVPHVTPYAGIDDGKSVTWCMRCRGFILPLLGNGRHAMPTDVRNEGCKYDWLDELILCAYE